VFIKLISVFILLILAPDTFAAGRSFATQQEILSSQMKYLGQPEYCQQKLLDRDISNMGKRLPQPYKAASDRWISKIGPHNWIYFHHYCWGVSKTNAALSKSGKSQSRLLKSAQGEFKFMKERADGRFPLWGALKKYNGLIDTTLEYNRKNKK